MIPRLLFGTERLGTVLPGARGASERDTFRLLDELHELGCRGVDCAASYQLGGSERLLGRWLSTGDKRSSIFLVSKGGHPYPLVKPNRLGKRDLEEDLHGSLKRLQTDHIDLYLLHRDHPDARLDEIALLLSEFVRAGKIRAWGVSNWTHDRILELERITRAVGGVPLTASSPQFSLAEWTSPPWKGSVSIAGAKERAARAFYARNQLSVFAYSALGRGFFSDGRGRALQPAYQHAVNEAKKRRARELAARRGVSVAEIALAYLYSQPFPVHAVVSASSAAHMKTNLLAERTRLSDEERDWLEAGAA